MSNKSSFFYKTWSKQILFIVIPIAVVFIASTAISESLKNTVIEQHRETTQNAIRIIDAELDEMGKISYQILNTTPVKDIITLEKSIEPEFYHKIFQIDRAFLQYKNNFDFGNILLYFGNNDVAISSRSMCTDAKKYYGKMFNFSGMTADEFKNYLSDETVNDVNSGSVKLGVDVYNGVIFKYKFTVPNNDKATTHLFITLENSYIDMQFNPLTKQQAQISIKNSDGELVYKNSHYSEEKLKSDKYVITEVLSDSGLAYSCYTPKKNVLAEVTALNLILVALSMIVLLFSIVIFTMMCVKNGNLVNSIAQASGITVWKKNQSVFETIEDAMTSIVSNNRQLSLTIDESLKTLRKEFFLHLFITGFNLGNDVTFYAKNANMDLKNSHYCILLLSTSVKKPDITFEKVLALKEINIRISEKIETFIGGIGHAICKGCEELIIVLKQDSNVNLKEIIKDIIAIHASQLAGENMDINACASTESYSIEELPRIYFECAKRTYTNFVSGIENEFPTWCNKTHKQNKQTITFFEEQSQSLIKTIKDGNKNDSYNILKQMFFQAVTQNEIDNNARSIFVATCKNVLVNASLDKTRSLTKEFECLNSLSLSPMMYRFLDDSLEKICEQNNNICKIVRRTNPLQEKISNYFENNISNPNLSLKTVSSEFGFTPTYFSTLFKETMGDTLSSYIDSKRMALAKELLLNDNMRIEDISLKCGYSEVNTFRRVFKKFYGLLPSQFNS